MPIMNERKYSFEGAFHIKELYSALSHFMEKSRNYDLTEKDFAERNTGDTREIISKNEAELYFNDYYEVMVKYTIEMKGKVIDVEHKGKMVQLIKGKAVLSVNAYIIPDYLGRRNKGPLREFLDKIYTHYFGDDELGKAIARTGGDVSGLVSVFRQQVNSYIA